MKNLPEKSAVSDAYKSQGASWDEMIARKSELTEAQVKLISDQIKKPKNQ